MISCLSSTICQRAIGFPPQFSTGLGRFSPTSSWSIFYHHFVIDPSVFLLSFPTGLEPFLSIDLSVLLWNLPLGVCIDFEG